MPDVPRAPFGDLVALVTEKVTTGKDPSKPYVGLEHIPSDGTCLLGVGTAGDSISTNNVFQAGDVLFGKLRPRLRKSVRVAFDGYCSTDVLVLRAKPAADSRFAGFVAQSDAIFAGAIRTEEGTKMPRCSWHDLRKIQVFAPDPAEQRTVAELLAIVDEGIEQTEAAIAKTRLIQAGLIHDLFTRGVTPAGTLRPRREEAPQSYVESPLGWIPKDWKIRPLRDLADINRGKFTVRPRNDPRYYGGDYPFIQTGDVAVASGRVLSSFTQTLNARGLAVSRMFAAGTIVVTIAANIADTCILGIPMCAPDSLVGVAPHDGEVTRFLELSIRRRKRWFENRAPQTAQKNINLEDLRPLSTPYPEPEEQKRIAARYEASDGLLVQQEHAVAKLRKLKRGLMSDLFAGRVSMATAGRRRSATDV